MRDLLDIITDSRQYFVYQLESILDEIRNTYPAYHNFLSAYWQSEYKKNEQFLEKGEEIDYPGMRIANQKLREAYLEIENSILGDINKDPKKRFEFELDFYKNQKDFLMRKVKEKDSSEIEHAENLWKQEYNDANLKDLDYSKTCLPEYHHANKELRKFCASLMK